MRRSGDLRPSSSATSSALKVDRSDGQVLLQMGDRRGARNEQDVRRAGQQPGQPDLLRSGTEPPGDGAGRADDRPPSAGRERPSRGGRRGRRRSLRAQRSRIASAVRSTRLNGFCTQTIPASSIAVLDLAGVTLEMPMPAILPSSRSATISASWSSNAGRHRRDASSRRRLTAPAGRRRATAGSPRRRPGARPASAGGTSHRRCPARRPPSTPGPGRPGRGAVPRGSGSLATSGP